MCTRRMTRTRGPCGCREPIQTNQRRMNRTGICYRNCSAKAPSDYAPVFGSNAVVTSLSWQTDRRFHVFCTLGNTLTTNLSLNGINIVSWNVASLEHDLQNVGTFRWWLIGPSFGLLVISAQGFKVRLGPLSCMLFRLCKMDPTDWPQIMTSWRKRRL